MRSSVIILIFLFLSTSALFASETVYHIDFSGQKDGNAQSWLIKNGFELQNDADGIKACFENGRLVLEVDDDINGLFTKSLTIKGASRIRIEWGVDRYLKGADWEKGEFREAIGIIISFGDEKISSGSFIIPDVPYFIGLFLGQYEIEGKAYLGNYYKKGGRFFCSPCRNQPGQTVVTEFNLSETFKREFRKSPVPYISAVSLEIDARGTNGRSRAFIKSISFLSP